jgi:hypothetical protein
MRLSRSVDLDVSPTGVLQTHLPRAGIGNRIIHLANLIVRSPSEIIDGTNLFGFAAKMPTIVDPRVEKMDQRITLQRRHYDGPTLSAEQLAFTRPGLNQFPLKHERLNVRGDQDYLVLHVRLGDFHKWRPGAIMDKSFFTSAAEMLYRQDHDQCLIISDEPRSAYLQELEFELTRRGILGKIVEGRAQEHMSLMCNANVIVASPSSFSLCGAWMGNQQIVWQREWAERSAIGGSKFWHKACENAIPFLDVTLI